MFLNFGEINVLEHIILRCRFAGIEPIVCTTKNKEDNKIVKISKKLKHDIIEGQIKINC